MRQNESIKSILSDMRNYMLSRKSILTVHDLESYTGYSKSTIYKLTANLMIPHFKPSGKQIFFKRTEIDQWLLSNPIKTINQAEFQYNKKITK